MSTNNIQDSIIESDGPHIFIQQLFKLQSRNLINDEAIKDQVNLLIFGVSTFFNITQECFFVNNLFGYPTY